MLCGYDSHSLVRLWPSSHAPDVLYICSVLSATRYIYANPKTAQNGYDVARTRSTCHVPPLPRWLTKHRDIRTHQIMCGYTKHVPSLLMTYTELSVCTPLSPCAASKAKMRRYPSSCVEWLARLYQLNMHSFPRRWNRP
ncbi:hypothetical protein BDZ89DRAFT_112387 [Hymenopellis radicata]|nr:hypothetical protein BDZ89DRAFT_112387 [Hymenopellis radicata]